MKALAASVIESLKQHPAMLALLVMQIALLVFIFLALNSAAKFRETMLTQVLENSQTIHAIIRERAVACPGG
jgi:hypothetical protein